MPSTTISAAAWTRVTPASTTNAPVACSPRSDATFASSCSGHSRTRGGATVSDGSAVSSAASNFAASKRKVPRFDSGTGLLPVSGASRSTARHRLGSGRLIVHSGRRRMFATVWPSEPSPSTTV